MTVLVAVTGNIGTGKSTLSRLLEEHGARRVDADHLAHQVVDDNPRLRRCLAEAFGPDLLDADGQLDRRALARRALADECGRSELERIVRPELEPLIWRELDAAQSEAPVVVFDAPLVFEWGMQDRFDAIVLIRADAGIAATRVAAERGLSPEEVAERRGAQRRFDDRESVAYVVDNDGDMDELRAAAAGIWEDLARQAGSEA